MTLQPDTEVYYKVTDFYAPENDTGLLWNDPTLNIAWPAPAAAPFLSPKDAALPSFKNFMSPFAYDGTPLSLIEVN